MNKTTGLAALLVCVLTACGGGGASTSPGSPEVLLQPHPVASNAGPLTDMAARAYPSLSTTPMLDASSLFDWAESTYPDLLNTHQTNQTHDIWTYRYYPNTDIYLGVNTHGDVLALVGKGDGTYDSVPLGKLGDYACLVNPGNCAETASKTVEGIHIHRTGMIGPFDPKMQIDGYKELCEGATAQALGIAEPFVLVGNPADLGATEQD